MINELIKVYDDDTYDHTTIMRHVIQSLDITINVDTIITQSMIRSIKMIIIDNRIKISICSLYHTNIP